MHFFDFARSKQTILDRETTILKHKQLQLSRDARRFEGESKTKRTSAERAYKRGDKPAGLKILKESVRLGKYKDRYEKAASLLEGEVHALIEAGTGVSLNEAIRAANKCLKTAYKMTTTGAAQAVEDNALYMEQNRENMKQIEDAHNYDQDQVDEETNLLAQEIEDDILSQGNMMVQNMPAAEVQRSQPQTVRPLEQPELVNFS